MQYVAQQVHVTLSQLSPSRLSEMSYISTRTQVDTYSTTSLGLMATLSLLLIY